MTQNQINHYNSLMKQDAEHKEKVIEILETDFGWRNIEQRDELVIEMMQDTIEATKKAFSLTDVVKPFVCELKEFGRQDKPCDKQCSSCKWFEHNAN